MNETINVTIRLDAPLAHGAFSDSSAGNMSLLRREPVVALPGAPRVPCVSGNALRGVVRRIVMRGLFDAAGVSRGKWADQGRSRQWDRMYAALANGGHLERPDASVDPERIRGLRRSLPPLSVLGAAMYRYMLTGRLRAGWCWPVCRETVEAGLAGAAAVGERALVGAEDLVTETSLVRHVDRDQQNPETSGVTPMPTTVEAIAAGAVLQSRMDFERGTDDVQRGVIAWGLDRVRQLGGKGGAGLGAVRIEHDGDPAPYEAWLEEAASGLGAVLGELADDLSR